MDFPILDMIGGKYSSGHPKHTNREIRDVVDTLVRLGWTVKTGTHWKLIAPDGRVGIPISTSSSDRHAVNNIIKDVRRYGGFDVRPYL